MSQNVLNEYTVVNPPLPPPVSHTYVNPNVLHGTQLQYVSFAPHQMQHLTMSPNMYRIPPPMLVQKNFSDAYGFRIAAKLQELRTKEIYN